MCKDVKGNRVLPGFICIGAQRAGTTWLYECLKEHPDLFLPSQKELHFFNKAFDKGLPHYESFFSECANDKKLKGEITPNYYHDKQALQRIKDTIPAVKLIYIIREPISRAYSHYQLSLIDQCKGMTFEQAMDTLPIIANLSRQGEHLQNILSLFDKKQVHVCFYEDIEKDPLEFYRAVLSFLDVDSTYCPHKLTERVNRIILPRFQQSLAALGLTPVIEFIKATPLGKVIKQKYNASGRKQVTEKRNDYLAMFSDDITTLENILNINLSHWRK